MRLAVVAAAVLAAGCVHTGTANVGRDFDMTVARAVPQGATQEEVKKLFGDPQAVKLDADGLETWTYSFTKSTATMNMWAGTLDSKALTKSATFSFKEKRLLSSQVSEEPTTSG